MISAYKFLNLQYLQVDHLVVVWDAEKLQCELGLVTADVRLGLLEEPETVGLRRMLTLVFQCQVAHLFFTF